MFSKQSLCDPLTEKVCFQNMLFVILARILPLCALLIENYVMDTYFCGFDSEKVYDRYFTLCVQMYNLLPVYYLCLSRPHVLDMSLARFDSVLSTNRLPLPLALTKFGSLLNPLVHIPQVSLCLHAVR